MSDLMLFKAELLSGTHTCEKCGKLDENSNRVTIKKGNKKEERVLCLSCTVKVKQSVEKTNTSSIETNANNIVAFPVKNTLKPNEPEILQVNTAAAQQKQSNKKTHVTFAIILGLILIITAVLGIKAYFKSNYSLFRNSNSIPSHIGDKFTNKQELLEHLEGYWYYQAPNHFKTSSITTYIYHFDNGGNIKTREMIDNLYCSDLETITSNEYQCFPEYGLINFDYSCFVINKIITVYNRDSKTDLQDPGWVAYTLVKGVPDGFSEKDFNNKRTEEIDWYDYYYSNSSNNQSVESHSYNSTNSSYSSFRNKYGTPTTICAHPGCTNYIASSGDTNCCSTHSNKCIECGCYIDEDAHWCVSCLKKAAGQYQ